MASEKEIREKFEDNFLNIPDVDESLVNKDNKSKYIDSDVQCYEYWFRKGYERATTDFLSMKAKEIITYID